MPPSGEAVITPARGGVLTVDRITVEFPAGAVAADTLVRLEPTEAPPATPTHLKLAYTFEVKLLNPTTRAEMGNPLGKAVQVTLDYGGLPLKGARERHMALYTYDHAREQWELLPSKNDRQGKKVTGQATHFSHGGGGSDPLWEPSPPVSLDGFQVDLMTGAASFQYPIELPRGAGGLTPRLGLSHSSSMMDAMNKVWLDQGGYFQGNGGDNDSPGVQASWVGAGWDMDMGFINCDSVGSPTSISVNGASDKLVLKATGPGWKEYRTERENFWKIMFYTSGGLGRAGFYVDAWDKEGTRYRFGYNMDSECHDGDWPYKYMLDLVQDTNSNYFTLSYFTIPGTTYWDPSNQFDQQVYLERIDYTGNWGTSFTTRWKVIFNRRSRTDYVASQYGYRNEYCLDSIDVQKADGTMVRKYIFDYEYGDAYWYKAWTHDQIQGLPKLLLKSITLCDNTATAGATSNPPGSPSGLTLPKHSFTYYRGQPGQSPTANLQMATGENGQGGKITYAYLYDAAVELPPENLFYHARVTGKTLQDGLAGSSTYTYSYGTLRQGWGLKNFWGHLWTQEVDPAGHWTNHFFYVRHYDDVTNQVDPGQNNQWPVDIKVMRGKRWKLEAGASGSGTPLRREVYDWRNQKTDPAEEPSRWFVYLEAEELYIDDMVNRKKRRAYAYDKTVGLGYYDGYGNWVDKWEYEGASGNWYRHTQRAFAVPSVWIVDKPRYINVYKWDGTTNGWWVQSTSFFYDENPTLSGVPNSNYPPTGPANLRAVRKARRDGGISKYQDVFRNYDGYGNMIEEKAARTWGTDTAWGGNPAITQWKDEAGALGYESAYRTYPKRVYNPLSHLTDYVYDPRWGAPTSVTDPNGAVTLADFDSFGRPVKVARPGDTLASPTVEHSYRNYQASPLQPYRLETTRKKNGTDPAHKTRTFFDGLGRQAQGYSDAVSAQVVVNTHYNSRGLKEWESAPYLLAPGSLGDFDQGAWNDTAKPRSQYVYDALRRPTTVTNPDNTQRSSGYSGLDVTLIDENSHKVVRKMDAFGRMVVVEEYQGANPWTLYATTTYGYDVLDNLASVLDNAGNPTNMVYDELSRKTQMADPDMGTWNYGYDIPGNLISQTDARGITITFTYDLLNRLIRKYYPVEWVDAPLTTSHMPGVYDLMELRASIDADRIAANQVNMPWSNPAIVPGRDVTIRGVHFNEMRDPGINALWWVASIGTPPQFTRGSIQADPPRAISLQDPTDLRNWLAQFENSAWAGQNGNRARDAYRYDNYTDGQWPGNSFGRRTEMWDASGHTRWTYDNRGRIIKEEKWIDGQIYVTEWTYDAMDRIVTMKYPDGEVVTYTYNAQLLLATMSGTNTYVSGTSYNGLDRPTQIALGNGRVTDIQYCWLEWAGKVPFGAIAWIKTTKNGYPDLQDLRMTYDNVGNPTQVYDPRNGETISFGYDELDRLISAGAPINGSYSHNQIGNLLSKSEGGVPYTFDYYQAPHKHAPVTVTVGGVPVPYTYDANGNLTNRSGFDFKYDAENRLVKISLGTAYVIRLAYDGDGKRAKRVDDNGTVHCAGPHYERNVGTGASPADTITKNYYAQIGPFRRLVAFRRAGVLYFVHSDHLGSSAIFSDETGYETGAVRYHSYGQTRLQSGSVVTDKRYTGQTLDLSTGLYFYGARYYNPAVGMFGQPDTIVPQPGNPQSLNRYSYCVNNPLKYTDPTGHFFILVIGLAVAGAAAYAWLSHPSPVNAPAEGERTVPSNEWASTRAGMASAPGTGDVNDVVAFATGRDPLLGEDLGPVDRAITGFAAGVPVMAAPVLRQGIKGAADVVLDTLSEIPITAYKKLQGLGEEGLLRHHILEKRFDEILGQRARDMLSIATDPGAHQWVTNEWRKAIGYIWDRNPLNTATATLEDILREGRRIYADFPEILRKINDQFPE